MHKNHFVFLRTKFLFVYRAVDRSVNHIQHFDATMKMSVRIVMLAREKFDRIRFIVKGFVNDVLFHDVNIW